jgi:hypothetical protein
LSDVLASVEFLIRELEIFTPRLYLTMAGTGVLVSFEGEDDMA